MDPKVKANSNNNTKYDDLIKDKSSEVKKPLNEKMEESSQQPNQDKLEYFTE